MSDPQTMNTADDFRLLLDVLTPIGHFVHENQSLVAGVMALGAAFWAARPVWEQLKSLNRQVEIQSFGLVESQIDRLQRIRQKIEEKTKEISEQVFRAQYPNMPPWEDDTEASDIQPTAAFNLDQAAHHLDDLIGRLSKQRRLPQSCIDEARGLQVTLLKFANTAQDIHVPESVEFDDPELAIANWEQEKENAIAKAKQAQLEIDAHLADVNNAAKALVKQLDEETDLLLRRRQNIHEGTV